ncbi:Ferredoxin--NADP(+) reductase [Marinobacterium lacunae]|uniref:ferredoxin--NADP(+) reductase n=1 Tax=Marinobacterium lacunae TaxID=1232683 RepID=A0A081FWN9_9GAMM|nr:ferredoxin--NADP reductase [Marinobacterium lacunae]KEA62944.1 Ferredoxin--NADP(+) reductase [Marinobacterium lacunae]MBR9884839.1 ferredoxin--NADP reductase [Oceanospirillales bacterium]
MASVVKETVTRVHHWNDTLFSIRTSRGQSLRFENGHFVMLGLEVDGLPLMRAYSIASANYEEELEFFSIKVPDGPLTSRLQNIQVGDEVLVSTKPTGTLVSGHLLDGKHLYLLSTGTGLAPFMSIIKDPEIYEQFDKVILVHGVRHVSELAYREFIERELPDNELFGELVREKLIYYPTVTREAFTNNGRLTDLMLSGRLFRDIGLPTPNRDDDRFMICGSPSMLKDTCAILDEWGFEESRHGERSHYVIERAFVER